MTSKQRRAAKEAAWRKAREKLAPSLWVRAAIDGHLQQHTVIGYDLPQRTHRQHQQGDEIACSCGRRWPVGENHP